MSHAATIAHEFRTMCEQYGFAFAVEGTLVRLTRRFTPESLDEFTACDVDYPSVAYVLPHTGSVFGTDGGGMGAVQALRTGVFTIKVTGVRATVCKELSK